MEHGQVGAGEVSAERDREVTAVIEALTREVADFPEPGIQFKDLTPVLADAHGLAVITEALAELAEGAELVAGIDAGAFWSAGRSPTSWGSGCSPCARQASCRRPSTARPTSWNTARRRSKSLPTASI